MKEEETKRTLSDLIQEAVVLLKSRYIPLLKLGFLIAGPIFVLQLLFGLVLDTPFLFGEESGRTWIEVFLSQQEEEAAFLASVPLLLLDLLLIVTYPLIFGAGLYFLVWESDAKEAFRAAGKRYFALIGAWIGFSLVMIGISIGGVLMVVVTAFTNVLILSFIGLIIMAGLLIYMTARLSLFLGFSMIDKKAPGISRSWEYTKGRGWWMAAYLAVFIISTSLIDQAVGATLEVTIGVSITALVIQSIVYVATSLIVLTAYVPLFKEMKRRNYSRLGVDA
ncbi:hypothetical protein [Alkalicoccus urumqiensis]|uniref:Glycerophosphoryl diester phosphodiesterase membrane domain-containing protein n=1 Tax=Alkalicoccus urumqiensis TaxID=1548213 RepID=A0A2P6MIG0_ALKUR|nr:hypothetical protein [Alkalicoccus urumqiensis]PRO66060.1 hypothetical protein C6I21_07095 [Alkalicoccus urumqiensis]